LTNNEDLPIKTNTCRHSYYHRKGITPFRRKLICLIVLFFFSSTLAFANPHGPQVVNGNVSFNTQGNKLTITNSPNSIINWQGFSIGVNELTRFVQQSGGSAVLNRVIGQDPSAILGALQSNGRVFLINPNGIIFGAGARIDVNGLIASTLNLSNQDFLAGRYNFTAGLQAGSIVNQGTITTPTGGQVYLIAPDIKNTGIINSPKGEVILAAGHSVQLVDSMHPDIAVTISAPQNSVLNLGKIIADSGRVGIYGGLINQKGIVKADSAVMGENGQIIFKATKGITLDKDSITTASGPTGGKITIQSETDTTLISGTVSATGSEGKGGDVQILGKQVGLTDNALVDVSGKNGGGTVLVGGDYQGKNPEVQNAEATYVGKDATIKADATETGDGGKVIVWSDGDTSFAGKISARGGLFSGNGGFVETSGHKLSIGNTARVSTLAPKGRRGSWLIDPADFTIASGGDMTGSELSTNLAGGDVTIETTEAGTGDGDITVNDTVSWTSGYDLTLNAYRNININAALTHSGTVLNKAGLTLTTNTGKYVTGANGSVNLDVNDSLTINGNSYTLLGDINELQSMGLTGYYALRQDIDASTTSLWSSSLYHGQLTSNTYYGFEPIGYNQSSSEFRGAFNGNGHKINNLYINRGVAYDETADNVGLFGCTLNASISNVGLVGSNITGRSSVGSLIGSGGDDTRFGSSGYIINVSNTGIVKGTGDQIGGLVGSFSGNMSDSYNTGEVKGSNSNFVGGLVGVMNCGTDAASINNSYNTGAVTNTGSDAGGVGGLVGMVGTGWGNSISYSYNTGAITGTLSDWSNVGGLVGENAGSISHSYNTGTVTGGGHVGGVAGTNKFGYNNSSITNSYNTGTVSGTNHIGGLVGYNELRTIADSYSIGNVTGSGTKIGGLVGSQWGGSIATSFSSGAVSGGTNVGGLLGYNDPAEGNTGTIINSYWDKGTSGQMSSAGGTGMTTAEMKTLVTFSDSGWDIANTGGSSAVWRIYEGNTYPLLRSFLTTATVTANNAIKTYDGIVYSGGNGVTCSTGSCGAGYLGTLAYSGTSQSAINASASSYVITPSGYYSNQQGYDISFADGALTVNKAPLSVTANADSKTYNGLAYTGGNGVVYTGFVNGELAGVLVGEIAYGGTSQGAINAGNYLITPSGQTSGNYAFTYNNGALTVNKAPLSVTANADSKTYNRLAYTGGNGVVYTGFVNGESVAVLGGEIAYGGTSQGAINAGNYLITPSGRTSGNYAFTYNDGALTVNKANLTITAATNTKTYDGGTTAAATPTASGLQSGDTLTGLSEAYDTKHAGSGKTLTVTGYTVNDGNSGNNYNVSTVTDTTGVIDKANLTITAASNTKTYDGNTSAAATPTYSGLQSGDTLTGLSEAYDTKHAGTAKTLTVTSGYTLNDGNSGNNYNVSTVTDTTGVIDKANLTITAATNTKGYDRNTSAAATPTITSGSLAGGDTATLTEVYDSKIAGTNKTLTPAADISDGNSGNNYRVTYVNSTTGVIDPGQIVSGMLDVAAGGKTIDFAVNGTLLPDQASTDGNGNYSMMFPLNSIPNSSALLAYVANDGSVKSASVYLSTGGDISNLVMSSNTVTAGSGGGTMSNTTMGTAKGSLAYSDIPYSVSGTNLTLSPNFNFKTTSGTTYSINGKITTTNGAQNYNGPVTLPGNAVISAGTGNISLGGPVTGTGYNFTLDSQGTVTQTAPISVSGLELLGTGGTYTLTDAANAVKTLAGNTGTVDFTNSAGMSIGTVNTAGLGTSGNVKITTEGDITLNGLVSAGTGAGAGRVTLSSGGAIINGMGGSTSISGGSLFAKAGNGIGHHNALKTEVSNLTAKNTGGSNNIEITNTGALNVTEGILNSGSGDIILDNTGAVDTGANAIKAAGGSVTITAHSPLTVGSGGVTAERDVTLEASQSESEDKLTVNGPVKSNSGDVNLKAADEIEQNSSVDAPSGNVNRTVNGSTTTDGNDSSSTSTSSTTTTQQEQQAVVQSENATTTALNNTNTTTVEQQNAQTEPPPPEKKEETTPAPSDNKSSTKKDEPEENKDKGKEPEKEKEKEPEKDKDKDKDKDSDKNSTKDNNSKVAPKVKLPFCN